MKNLSRQLLIMGCTMLCYLTVYASPIDKTIYSKLTNWELLQKVKNLRTVNTEKAIEFCKNGYEYYMAEKDTISAIDILLEESTVHGHKAQYQEAYDRVWNAYLLANKTGDRNSLVKTKNTLGRYSSFYKREKQAFRYLKDALTITKELVSEGLADEGALITQYYLIGKTYREMSNNTLAKTYLDSCYLYNINPKSFIYTSFKIEEAILNSNPQKGIDGLNEILPILKKNDIGYQVLVYKYLGDKYIDVGNYQEAEKALLTSINISDKHKSHLDFSPLIYKSLSKLYALTGEYQKAYQASLTEKRLDALYFDSRSENNHSLLFIRDKYQEEVEKGEKLLQQQKMDRLEIEERESFLKNVVLTVFLIFALLSGYLYFSYIKNKHQNEKRLISKKKELEIKNTTELLELKNRELAVSSLKLIEKDELLASFKEKLANGTGDIKREDVKKLVRSISHSNSQNWDEFETRFTSVNRDFYQKLNAKYPKLTRGDQKLCALVKLNLSSKEMAKLLGISIESVHTNRYRLRKKLSLARETSLTEFVSTLN